MSSKHRRASILSLAIALGACTTSATGSPPASSASPSAVAVATLTPTAITATPSPATASPAASPSSGGGGSGATQSPPAIDPCDLLTADEASTVIGKKLGAGVSTLVDQDRECTFRSGLSEVKLILAPPAPDAVTAQAYWDAERAQVPADVPVKDLAVFDRSAYGSGSAGGLSISALFVIDGTTFFDLFCANPACPETRSVAAAELITGRLP